MPHQQYICLGRGGASIVQVAREGGGADRDHVFFPRTHESATVRVSPRGGNQRGALMALYQRRAACTFDGVDTFCFRQPQAIPHAPAAESESPGFSLVTLAKRQLGESLRATPALV